MIRLVLLLLIGVVTLSFLIQIVLLFVLKLNNPDMAETRFILEFWPALVAVVVNGLILAAMIRLYEK